MFVHTYVHSINDMYQCSSPVDSLCVKPVIVHAKDRGLHESKETVRKTVGLPSGIVCTHGDTELLTSAQSTQSSEDLSGRPLGWNVQSYD